jgi:hypothetical protein
MKKLFNYAMALAAGSFLFTSCASDDINDDTPRPTITVTEVNFGINNGDVEATPGSTLVFRWNAVKAGGGEDFDKFEVFQTGVNVTTPLPNTAGNRTLPLTSMPSAIRSQYIDTLVLNAGSNLGVTTYTFRVTDKNGLTAESVVRVDVKASGTPMTTEVTGQFFHIGGSLQGSYNLVAAANVASTAANEGVRDMSNTDAIGSPFTGSWDAKNSTRFVKANGFDYAGATVQAAEAAYNAGTAAAAVNGPVVGDIYIARLRGANDFAVIKITSVDPNNNDCNCGNRGKITFDFKK